MHAERDQLVKVVFPTLRERLEAHRVHLVDIDLRWGLTVEQAENDRVLDLCLQQIDDCRPFFIGVLGNRYGSVLARVPDAAIEKYPWTKPLRGKSITEIEIMHAVLNNPAMHRRAFFYIRDPSALDDVPEDLRSSVYQDLAPDRARRLEDLKQRICRSGCRVMVSYPARWSSDAIESVTRSRGKLVGLEAFSHRVEEDLWGALMEDLKLKAKAKTRSDPIADELDYHQRFIESRLRVYVEREGIHRRLLDYLRDSTRFPLLVTGGAGSGKSAILARLYRAIEGQVDIPVPHFVGASPSSNSLRQTLQRFCEILKARLKLTDVVPDHPNELCAAFRKFIEKVPVGRTCVFVIDAVDELDDLDTAYGTAWLPRELPPRVKIVLSCTDAPDREQAVLSHARAMGLPEERVQPLTAKERLAILKEVPSLSAKTLDPAQVSRLLGNPATETPLFLLVALEELRGFGSFERLNERIAGLPSGKDAIAAIFAQVIARLEDDFGGEPVRRILISLAAARRGLSERELRDLNATSDARDAIPLVLRQLRSYLHRRETLITFAHRYLPEAVKRRYLSDPEVERSAHAQVAAYFQEQPFWSRRSGDSDYGSPNVRKADELAWQYAQAGQLQDLFALLTDFDFLYAKTSAFGPAPVVEDLTMARTELSRSSARADKEALQVLEVLERTLRAETHILRRMPALVVQQIHNSVLPVAKRQAGLGMLVRHAVSWQERVGRPWFRLRDDGDEPSPDESARRVLCEDGCFADLAVRPGHAQFAAVRQSGTSWRLELWDMKGDAPIADLGDTDARILAIGWMPDGHYLLAVDARGRLDAYDAASFRLYGRRQVERSELSKAVLSEDGSTLAFVRKGTEVWRSVEIIGLGPVRSRAAAQATLPMDPWLCISINGDGTRLAFTIVKQKEYPVLGWLSKVAICDLQSGGEPICGKLEGSSVSAMAFASDSRRIAYGSAGGSVVVLDAATARILCAFPGCRMARSGLGQISAQAGHPDEVRCLAFSPDGSLLASGSGTSGRGIPGVVCIRDLESERLCQRISFPRGVESLAFSSDSRNLVVGGYSLLATLDVPGETPSVSPVAVSSKASEAADLLSADETVQAVAFAPDGESRALLAGADIIVQENDSSHDAFRFFANAGHVRCVDWSPRGELLASGGDDGACRLSRIRDGTCVFAVEELAKPVLSVQFSGDGSLLAASGGRGKCFLVSMDDRRVRELTTDTRGALNSVAFSPDGELLAAGGAGQVGTVWDVRTGSMVSQCRGHARSISWLQFTSAGHLATVGEDRTCRIWDARGGRQIAQCDGHSAGVYRVFSDRALPDLVMTASHDNTCRLWTESSGREVACLPVEAPIRGMSIARGSGDQLLVDARGNERRFSNSELLRSAGTQQPGNNPKWRQEQ